MPLLTNPKLEVMRQLAERYGVTVRSLYRYQRDGVNVGDLCEVALHVAGLKYKDTASLIAVKAELETAKLSQSNLMKTIPLPVKAPTTTASSFATPTLRKARAEFDKLTASDKVCFAKAKGQIV